jgi:Protein of unknown function (DUF551)
MMSDDIKDWHRRPSTGGSKGRPMTATPERISEWRPIETAPKDGTVILVFYPDGFEIDEHIYVWPERFSLRVTPARWHEPNNNRAHTEAGWYPPHFWLSFGPWDDASIDIDQIKIEPTHWMPLPEPPK